jgi:hypothetical protein
MKKGVTPSNYKDLVQKKLVADIFKTPDERLQDESKGEVQFNTKTRKPFEGTEDETVQLTSFDSHKSVRTSTPVGKIVFPRPQIPQSLLLHQTEHSTSQKTPGTPLRTPQSFFKPSIARLVPPPSSLPAATLPIPTTSGAPTVPIPTTSGATTLSSGISQNFNIFDMASNSKIVKFKGDNTQNVDTWLSMCKQYCSFYDLSDKKSALIPFPFRRSC